jgi:predicted MFS family arabinose efflux permease
MTPLAIRTVSRSGFPRALVLGASGLCIGTCLLGMVGMETPIVAALTAMVAIGASHAFSNLGLQAELSDVTSREQLGTAAGFFQTARFVGAALAAGLVGVVANESLTESLHRLWIVVGLLSFGLLAWATRPAATPSDDQSKLGRSKICRRRGLPPRFGGSGSHV